eukprot:Clim_evm44s144 gene=Clim_evmTU44s144
MAAALASRSEFATLGEEEDSLTDLRKYSSTTSESSRRCSDTSSIMSEDDHGVDMLSVKARGANHHWQSAEMSAQRLREASKKFFWYNTIAYMITLIITLFYGQQLLGLEWWEPQSAIGDWNFDEEDDDIIDWDIQYERITDEVCVCFFAMAMTFDLTSMLVSISEQRKVMCMLMCQVNGIALLTALLCALDMSPMVTLPYTKSQMYFVRYLEWIFTCPGILLMVENMTYPTVNNVATTMSLSAVTSLCGLLGSIVPEFWMALPFFLVSGVCFMQLQLEMFSMYTGSLKRVESAMRFLDVEEKQRHARRSSALLRRMSAVQSDLNGMEAALAKDSSGILRMLRHQSYTTWALFPLIFFLTYFDILSPFASNLGFVFADLAAKFVLSSTINYCMLEITHQHEVAAITGDARAVSNAKRLSDTVLGTLMPEDVMAQLLEGELENTDRYYDSTTVIFIQVEPIGCLDSDIRLAYLNDVWQRIDDVRDSIGGITKVDVLSDTMFSITGCPKENSAHASTALDFAIAVSNMRVFGAEDNPWGIAGKVTLGLSSGCVQGDILGTVNRRWVLIGDTVNLASRMQTTAMTGRVHVDGSVIEAVKTEGADVAKKFKYDALPRQIVKGLGEMVTYNARLVNE